MKLSSHSSKSITMYFFIAIISASFLSCHGSYLPSNLKANYSTPLEGVEYRNTSQDCRPRLDSQSTIYCPGNSSDTDPIELIGFLTSFDVNFGGEGTWISGAIPLAVENVNRSVSHVCRCLTFKLFY